MQSSTSMSTGTCTSPLRPTHRRQRSAHAHDIQNANTAGRPFAFLPRRRPSSEDKGVTKSEKWNETSNPTLPSIFLQGEPPVASPSIPHVPFVFPGAKSEPTGNRSSGLNEEIIMLDSPLSDALTPTQGLPPKDKLHLDLYNPTCTHVTSAVISTQANATTSVATASAHPHAYPASAGLPSTFSPMLIRKKSGEPIKSSLKPATWSGASRTRTKSAPSTPIGQKYVHFDAQLEHVKLFLAEQKPLAVSRDGSPTETSEGETSEGYPFPPLLPLQIKPIAVPDLLPETWSFDVQLESIVLEGTTLKGLVLARNIAFAKRVVARFTLDRWQTVSEVVSRHVVSLREGTFDRFEFCIRLGDYLGGIETKRLVLCIRYLVAGQELWDNNNGRNYEIGFERARKKANATTAVDTTSSASIIVPGSQRGARRTGLDSMVDLQKQLEKVVQHSRDLSPPRSVALQRSHASGLRVWIGDHSPDEDQTALSPTRPRASPPLNAKDAEPLSARYDFGASLKSPAWTPPSAFMSAPSISATNSKLRPSSAATSKLKTARPREKPPPTVSTSHPLAQSPNSEHRRNITIPVGAFSPRAPHPRGSPRDSTDYAGDIIEDFHRLHYDEEPPRHHTRGWQSRSSYFDYMVEDACPIRKTPHGIPPIASVNFNVSGSSSESTSSSDSPSGSPDRTSHPVPDSAWGVFQGDSMASTPNTTSSESTPAMSPLCPLKYLSLETNDEASSVAAIPGLSRAERPPVNSTPYHSFLNRFCFFTGVEPQQHGNNMVPRRAHSASSVEDYFAASPPLNDGHLPRAMFKPTPSGHTTPTRSPIPADLVPDRGLATPRPGTSNDCPPSPASTSVAG